MAARRGRLTPLAIVTIFVVVLGTMHVGVQYSRGQLLDREPATDLEAQLRADLRAAVDAEREARGLPSARRGEDAVAQDTARWLAEADYFEAATAAGHRPGAARSLPNRKGFCRQVPARLTVEAAGWTPSGDVPRSVTRRVARRLVGLVAGAGEADVLDRRGGAAHGIGVAIRGDVVYVVYRVCNLGY